MNLKVGSIEKHRKKVKPPSLLRLNPLLKNGQSEAKEKVRTKKRLGQLTLKHKATPTFYLCIKFHTCFHFPFTTEDF